MTALPPAHGFSAALKSCQSGSAGNCSARAMRLLAAVCPLFTDCVAKRFWASERVSLIQNRGATRNLDSSNTVPRLDRCAFLFHRLFAATFATWGNSGIVPHEGTRESALQEHMRSSSCGLATMESCDGTDFYLG